MGSTARDQIVGTFPSEPRRSHFAPPSWLTKRPVSPPAKIVCASVGCTANAWMRLFNGKGERWRSHDLPASGLFHTPQPAVPRQILYPIVMTCLPPSSCSIIPYVGGIVPLLSCRDKQQTACRK